MTVPKRQLPWLPGILALLVGTTIPGPTLAGPALPTGFEFESVAAIGFEDREPTAFAFLPDGRVLIVERMSALVHLVPLDDLVTTTIYQILDVNTGTGERGVLGLAVDPAWPLRPYVYALYTHLGLTTYITQFEATGDLFAPTSSNLSLANPFHVIADLPDDFAVHHGGTIRFGKDGMLYVSVGDNIAPCRSQDLDTFHGKLLRLDVSGMPEIGTGPPLKTSLVPPGNPFFGPDDDTRLIFAYGLRNPFRFTVDGLTGDVFVGDVGHNNWEEVDRIPFLEGGQNFGWPGREGFGEPNPPIGGCTPDGPYDDPIFTYDHVGPTANAIIGGPLYRYDPFAPRSFPLEYDGSYFCFDHLDGWMKRIVPSSGAWEEAAPVLGQPSPENWGEGIHYVADAQLGPDGAIWVLKRYQPFSGPGSEHEPGLYRIARTLAATGVAASPTGVPGIRVVPNPARAGLGAWIGWAATPNGSIDARSTPVRVFDSAGRVIRRLESGESGGAVHWDARDEAGVPVHAGVYFLRIDGADRPAAKVTVVR